MNGAEQLETYLQNLSWVSADFKLSPLKGGTINHNYKLQSDTDCYLVKNFVGEEFVLLTRNDSFALQRKLAELGLAPEPVHISDDDLIHIEKWCEIETLNDHMFTADLHLPLLADSLTAVHNVSVKVDELPLLAQWQRYLNRIEKDQSYWQQRINNTAHLWMQAKRDCFCHHDLAFEHICLSPKGILLDWEYAARSNRYFDIANAVLVNQLSNKHIKLLCGYYGRQNGLSEASVLRQVIGMLPVAQLTADLWYAAAEQQTD
ncbi:phosphotransferase [Neptunicella sp. SCSIO 80796]|uniref:phosphotransferase n=1 Tax=Neptunicella plasticusilytica TaxID=3117012 RepID=UPI003A4D79CF